jgi:hypothetical protein
MHIYGKIEAGDLPFFFWQSKNTGETVRHKPETILCLVSPLNVKGSRFVNMRNARYRQIYLK